MATTQTAPKKGLINFDFLQKLGKVLMTVIAVMPAAGLMISLGKLVQMGGGDIAAVMTIGTTMENIGWAVINNLHILFAVAIGGSWAKERAGGAFAAVLAFALINVITGNIIPMQDWLGLDNSARINKPSTVGENWRWRLKKSQLTPKLQKEICSITTRYGRMNWA